MNIVLTGFMGTGKSAVGRELARRSGMSFMDLDEQISRDTGLTIPEIFKSRGEPYFREVEARAVELVSLLDKFVIATGGGAVLNPANLKALRKNGLIVNLTASVDVILERTKPWKDRPLLHGENPRQRIEEILSRREPLYKDCDLSVDTTRETVPGVVDKILLGLKDRFPPGDAG